MSEISRFKRWSTYVALVTGVLLAVQFLMQHTDHVGNTKLNRKLILGWTKFLGEGYEHKFWMRNCPQLLCDITSDRNQLNKADVVVFHMGEISLYDLPPSRHPWQRFLFHNLESPMSVPIPNDLRTFFNLTMTYRRDSDICNPYGSITIEPNPNFSPQYLSEIVRDKQFTAAWIVSNCHTSSRREKIVEEMLKVIDIHIFGNCGKRKCIFTNRTCIYDLGRKYKFYLPFENSLCKDYVTEKLFIRLAEPVVPVVLERRNYVDLLPEKALIALDDFESPQDLAEYLKFLSENDTAYAEHLQWRKDFVVNLFDHVETSANHGFCALCKALQDEQLPFQSITNIHDWWVEKAECRSL